jgi:hypothetical protein
VPRSGPEKGSLGVSSVWGREGMGAAAVHPCNRARHARRRYRSRGELEATDRFRVTSTVEDEEPGQTPSLLEMCWIIDIQP